MKKKKSTTPPARDGETRADGKNSGAGDTAFMSERFIGEDDLENADFEPECTCERVDVDLDDSRHCLAHGPDSPLARRNREAEAEQEAAFWRGMPEF